MKKNKLNLSNLAVQSFVTSVEQDNQKQLLAGVDLSLRIGCDTGVLPTNCCTGYYPSFNAPCDVK